ncbi:hypothetical protein GCM10028818_60820 [Spirosoma horti]
MKPTFVYLLLSILLFNCHNSVSPTDSLGQANQWINGKWKLTAVSTMIPNPTVPNVQLLIGGNQIILIQDGKQTDQVNFEIIKTVYDLQLRTSAQPRADNWYIRNPALRLSKNQMFLDAGMANDGPGFNFERAD